MTGLVQLFDEMGHAGQGFGKQALGGRVFLDQLKEAQRKDVAVALGLYDIAALLQANKHAKDLRDGAVQRACDLALGKAVPLMCQQLQDVQALLEGGCGVGHLGLAGVVGSLL